jgi:predicted ester cyclase
MAIDLAALTRDTFEEVWHRGNLAFVDQYFDPDYVNHDAFVGDVGRDGYKKIVLMFRGAFPDIRFQLDEVIVAGNSVTVRWCAEGTHLGPLLDAQPTGRHATVRGLSLSHYAGDRQRESWQMWDVIGMVEQLGTVPVMGMLATVEQPPPLRSVAPPQAAADWH